MKEFFFKILIYFIFCCLTFTCLGQNNSSNKIASQTIDSLKAIINDLNGLKGKIKHQEFLIRYLKELKKVDTTNNDADSLVIIATDANGKLLRKIELKYNSNVIDSTILFYSCEGLLEYGEVWTGNLQPTVNNTKQYIYNKRQVYRYEYDTKGRIIKSVIWLSTPIIRRHVYFYNEEGQKLLKKEKQLFFNFWD
jgi:hypothetical protein